MSLGKGTEGRKERKRGWGDGFLYCIITVRLSGSWKKGIIRREEIACIYMERRDRSGFGRLETDRVSRKS